MIVPAESTLWRASIRIPLLEFSMSSRSLFLYLIKAFMVAYFGMVYPDVGAERPEFGELQCDESLRWRRAYHYPRSPGGQ